MYRSMREPPDLSDWLYERMRFEQILERLKERERQRGRDSGTGEE